MKWFLLTIGFMLCTVVPTIAIAAEVDTDNDGVSDVWEAYYYTDAMNPDTDGDGYSDGDELALGFSPLVGGGIKMDEHDLDNDGLTDWQERWFKTDLNSADTDGDGYTDYNEVMHGYSPVQAGPTMRLEREILVNKSSQYLYYIVDGLRVAGFPVSTGNPNTETPSGTFYVDKKIEKKNYVGADYFVPDVWWNMQFIPMYYIHGTYWHNDFGKRTHSHGCVNMTNDDAKFLYKYVNEGFTVTVTGTTPAGFVVGS